MGVGVGVWGGGGGGGGGGEGREHANCLTTCLDYKTRGQLLIKGLL